MIFYPEDQFPVYLTARIPGLIRFHSWPKIFQVLLIRKGQNRISPDLSHRIFLNFQSAQLLPASRLVFFVKDQIVSLLLLHVHRSGKLIAKVKSFSTKCQDQPPTHLFLPSISETYSVSYRCFSEAAKKY